LKTKLNAETQRKQRFAEKKSFFLSALLRDLRGSAFILIPNY